MEESVKLTILIPTFNRKKQLLELLQSIENQGRYHEYKLIICDNHSDYSIEDEVLSHLSASFTARVDVNRWRFNTGMSTNISSSFLLIKTDWVWVIGDDDTICEGALDKILSQIKEYPNAIAIKNSLKGIKKHEDKSLISINDFIDYYGNPERSGEMMYLSMIYNLSKLQPYLTGLTEYSYCYLSFLIPILYGLAEGENFIVCSFEAINYRKAADDNWAAKRYLNIALGIRTILDVPFPVNNKQLKLLHKVLTQHITIGTCTKIIVGLDSKYKRQLYWKSLKPMLFNTSPWYKIVICSTYYYLLSLCRH